MIFSTFLANILALLLARSVSVISWPMQRMPIIELFSSLYAENSQDVQ
jgi:hypothetical protein